MTSRQCAILAGGLGTRLGALTTTTPKPLLDCGGRPFLAWVLRELSRFGVEDFVVLSGYLSDQIDAFVDRARDYLPKPVRVRATREPVRAGTGGALWHARDVLDEDFLLVNGDSWFDTNLARFMTGAALDGGIGHVLLRKVVDTSRYGVAKLAGNRIAVFNDRAQPGAPGIVNGGIYRMRKSVLDYVQPVCSLEGDVLPRLAEEGVLTGQAMDGYFIDIGSPRDYRRAQDELPERLHRPAMFFHAGLLGRSFKRAGSIEDFGSADGAQAAIRAVTDAGFHVFVVGGEAGDDAAQQAVRRARTVGELRAAGGAVDDMDDHVAAPDAIIAIARRWQIDRKRSHLIAGVESDLAEEEEAGVTRSIFPGGDFHAFVVRLLANTAHSGLP